jgi:hypothetical protein
MEPVSQSPGGAEGSGRIVARGRVLFLCGLLLICCTAAFVGVVPTRIFGHDNFFLLDNGWRVFCGQRPHVDYYSPWGPVTFLLVALGLAVSKASADAIGYASTSFALLVGLWAYGVGRNRLGSAARILFGLYLALLVTAPYPLGKYPLWTSHAMVYNRYGYALLGLVLVECMRRPEGRGEDDGEFWGGISTGAALGLALFLKVSYFGVGVVIVGAALIVQGLNRRRLGGMAVSFGAVALALLAYLKFDVARIGQDLWMAAGARSKAMSGSELVSTLGTRVLPLGIVMALILYGSSPQKQKGRWLAEHQLLVWGLLVFLADTALLFSNMQAGGNPLLGAFGIVVASWMTVELRRAVAVKSSAEMQRYTFVLLLCGVLFVPQLCSDLVGLGYGAIQKAHPWAERSRVRFSVARLRPMILYDGARDVDANGGLYTGRINAGIELLKRECGPGDRVLNLDMVNPFPYALGWRPPRGGMAAAAYNYLFSDELRPSDDAYFGDATVVMEPKVPALEPHYYEGYYRIYHPAMLERFRLAAESESWRLYKLK